jgi:regulator of cell morphogenesis and NO signaling
MLSQPDINSTLREWLAYRPGLSRILTKHGIDLCGEADFSLSEICQTRNLDPVIVSGELNRASRPARCELGADWSHAPLKELCQHIAETHHAFYQRELPRLAGLLEKVAETYAASHPEMAEVEQTFANFRQMLEQHLEQEQQELFPAIRELDQLNPSAAPPHVSQAIASLERDHDAIDGLLRRIRELTHGFVGPSDACQTFQSLLDGFWDLEMNLHQNIYEENRFLFPRAIRREAALSAAAT